MQKLKFHKLRVIFVLVCGSLAGNSAWISWGQPANSPSASQVPSDPVELMVQAAKMNRLTGAEMKPWLLKVSVDELDDEGKIKDHATYEELWAAPLKYKITYTSAAFSQTDYETEKGLMRSGSSGQPPALFTQIFNQFNVPLPDEKQVANFAYETKKLDSGGVKLVCLTVTGTTGVNPRKLDGAMYCLDDGRPLLRVYVPPYIGGGQFLRNNIIVFEGKYVPRDIEIARDKKVICKGHVDNVQVLDSIDEAALIPPPDAVRAPLRIAISSGVAQGNLLKSTAPEYPLYAKSAHIQGTVVIQATIGKDGHISDLTAISGPKELRKAAADAVGQWVYRPYLLNGEAVEVKTTVNVVFALGG